MGWLGSLFQNDNLPGTLSPAQPLSTTPGKQYKIAFFQASSLSSAADEADAFVDVMWNGQTLSTIHPGYSAWAYYEFIVTANGNDVLAFHGGKAPAFSFLDDIYVFEM
jgi:hypothetical protein